MKKNKFLILYNKTIISKGTYTNINIYILYFIKGKLSMIFDKRYLIPIMSIFSLP